MNAIIIKVTSKVEGVNRVLFFKGMKATDRTDIMNTFIQEFTREKENAHRFFDPTEAEDFLPIVKRNNISARIIKTRYTKPSKVA